MSKPWWFPKLCDKAYFEQLRKDYPEDCEGHDDETLLEEFNDGSKYSLTWDHVGDAREEYEPLADSYLELLEALKGANERMNTATYVHTDSIALAETIAKSEKAIKKAEGTE